MTELDDTSTRSASARGVSSFGGIVLATAGLFQFFQGLSAILNDGVYLTPPEYVYEFNLSLWGWIHLVVGAFAVAVGVAIVANQPWAFFIGIVLAVWSVLTQFLFVPYYPLWALTIMAIDFAVIWALCIRLREDWTNP